MEAWPNHALNVSASLKSELCCKPMDDVSNGEKALPSGEMKSVNDEPRRELSTIHRLRRANLFPWIPARYALAIISFLGLFNVYALRVNLSVAIVQMDNSTAQQYRHGARVSNAGCFEIRSGIYP